MTARRGPGGRWLKGASGNPLGPRPETVEQIEVRAMARERSPRAIERLGEIVESQDEHAAIRACEAILDRAYGKPKQEVEATVEHHIGDPIAELRRRLGAVPAGIGAGAVVPVEEPS